MSIFTRAAKRTGDELKFAGQCIAVIFIILTMAWNDDWW